MTGVRLIAEERERQIKSEGWTLAHDRESHAVGDLVRAAICYATHADLYGWWLTNTPEGVSKEWAVKFYKGVNRPARTWPWDFRWWKPKDPVRDLVKAAALIAAEIDRLLEGDDMVDNGLVQELKAFEWLWYNAKTAEVKEKRWQYLVDVTECLPSHPEGYDGPCFCADCKPEWGDCER